LLQSFFVLFFSLYPLLDSFERKKAVNEFDVQPWNAILTEMLAGYDQDNRNIVLLAHNSHKFADFRIER
jgi:hypothetical protein